MEFDAAKHNMMVSMTHDLMRQKPFLEMATLFRPHLAVGKPKIRVGDDFDGAYVMIDDFAGIELALSLGVGDLVCWDTEIAGRGIEVLQFDHTIPSAPVSHPKIRFHRQRVAAVPEPDAATIAEILNQAGVRADASVILKIDIEHDEWDVFDQCAAEDLAKFSQILVEFHAFSRATDPAWLRRATRVLQKLTSLFAFVHVHGNNWSPMISVSNVSFPDTLEACLANRSRYDLRLADEIFPGPLDRPCNPLLPEIFLGNFRYG